MEIWIEKKEQLNESELKEMHKLKLKDYQHYKNIIGNWDPIRGVNSRHLVYLVKTKISSIFRDSSIITGWIHFTNDSYRISHFVGRLDGIVDNYWHSFNTYVLHIYAQPNFQFSEMFYNLLLAEVEKGRQNIWADIYSDEYIYKQALENRNYKLFKSSESDGRIIETWYKKTEIEGFNYSQN